MLVIFYGQTRIFFAMCRDGLLPERLADVHKRYGTPVKLNIGLGVLIAILATVVPLTEIVKLVNIGTLFAFVLVNVGVIVLRYTRPEMPRPFRVPLSPVLPHSGNRLRCLPDGRPTALDMGSVRYPGLLSGPSSTRCTATGTPAYEWRTTNTVLPAEDRPHRHEHEDSV